MTDNRKDDLLPCPFCGGEAEFHLHHRTTKEPKEDRGGIRCITEGCFGRFASNYMSRAVAASAWNARFESPFATPCNKHKNISAYIVKNAPDNECFGCYMDAIKANERQRCVDIANLERVNEISPDDATYNRAIDDVIEAIRVMQEKQE